MSESRLTPLKDAVVMLRDLHRLDAKLIVIGDDLKLVAELTRHNFNDGYPVEVFHIHVVKGVVLRTSLDDAIDRYYERRNAGHGVSEISPMSILKRESALCRP
jgi:hypothetical protein